MDVLPSMCPSTSTQDVKFITCKLCTNTQGLLPWKVPHLPLQSFFFHQGRRGFQSWKLCKWVFFFWLHNYLAFSPTPSSAKAKAHKVIWATSWETLFYAYANNKGADPRSLMFVVRCLDSIISRVSISKISSLKSVAAQAGLSLTWSKTPKTGFLVTRLIL